MKNFQIGKSGIEVPFLGMGTWAIGGGEMCIRDSV